MNKYYLNKFKLNIDPDHFFLTSDIEIFYINIKKEFFNPMYDKWSVELFKQFINQNDLDVKICYSYLEKFNEIYFQRNQKGSKGFNKFLNSINKIKENSSSKININSNELLFLEELQHLRKAHFPNITNKRFINFVDENFNTGYTKNTLRRLLYEERIFKKLP